jgi:hypothetical protein
MACARNGHMIHTSEIITNINNSLTTITADAAKKYKIQYFSNPQRRSIYMSFFYKSFMTQNYNVDNKIRKSS